MINSIWACKVIQGICIAHIFFIPLYQLVNEIECLTTKNYNYEENFCTTCSLCSVYSLWK